MSRLSASTSCGWATRGPHATPSPCSPRRRSSPTGSGWPPASRTPTCAIPGWRPRACSRSTSSAAAEPCSGSVRGAGCRSPRSACRPPGRSTVCVSSSTSPVRLRPPRRWRVTRPPTSPSPTRPAARRCRSSWERAGLGSTGWRPSGPTVRSWPACLRSAIADVVGWARSVHPIDIALYPSVAFTEKAVERHRPEMIWSLLDTPPEVREELGLDGDAVKAAAEAIRDGDPEPARALVDDTVLERVMLVGQPSLVGRRLAELVREHRPTSVGLALVQDNLHEGVCHTAEAFAAMTAELRGDRGLEGDREPGGDRELRGDRGLEGDRELRGDRELEGDREPGGDRWSA